MKNKDTCSRCYSELLRQKKTESIELEILQDFSSNADLAPITAHLEQYTSLKEFRHLLRHLPSLQATTRRNDYIYGATRYIAKTLGIRITDNFGNDRLDQPMSDIQI